MKDKLTIEDLAPYLPYGLKIDTKGYFYEFILTPIELDVASFNEKGWKPILRPLSDLTKEIEHNRERFMPSEWFEIGDEGNNSEEYDSGNIKLVKNIQWASLDSSGHDARRLPYGVVIKLIEWHFDVFGLIEKGLAVDLNTIKLKQHE